MPVTSQPGRVPADQPPDQLASDEPAAIHPYNLPPSQPASQPAIQPTAPGAGQPASQRGRPCRQAGSHPCSHAASQQTSQQACTLAEYPATSCFRNILLMSTLSNLRVLLEYLFSMFLICFNVFLVALETTDCAVLQFRGRELRPNRLYLRKPRPGLAMPGQTRSG